MLPLYAFDLFLQVARGMIGCIVGRHSFVDGWLDDVKIPFLDIGVDKFLVDMVASNFLLQSDLEYLGFNSFYRI